MRRRPNYVLDAKSLPAVALHRAVGPDLIERSATLQAMQKARIADVGLGRALQPLCLVRVPGIQDPN